MGLYGMQQGFPSAPASLIAPDARSGVHLPSENAAWVVPRHALSLTKETDPFGAQPLHRFPAVDTWTDAWSRLCLWYTLPTLKAALG